MEQTGDRETFFREAKKDFQKFGKKTQGEIVNAIEYVLSRENLEKYWHQIIPQDLPVFVRNEKKEYVRGLFFCITGRIANENRFTEDAMELDKLPSNWHPSE
ncbi:hypothetical protein [Variovorax rhizosphaerae]|uniref:Uncharacterized protein n=1 Tax=Variovorax rhizosphaerae TaxID=1836200 RepID=A0ABU8WZ34_9BURK